MKGELGSLVKQLEKLDTKKEKLEGTVIKELEEHLADVEKELEELEREEEMGVATARPNPNWNSTVLDATIGRSSSLIRPRAIAHPVSLPHPSSNSQWTPITPPRQPTHMNKRSTSVPQPSLQHGNVPLTHPHHQQHVTTRPPTTILTNPNRQAAKTTPVREPSVEHLSLSNTTPSTSGLMFGSPGLVSNTISASTSNTSGGGSILSSRAPPFEPQAGLARGVGSIGGRSRSRVSGP
ncbi:hypothetical protein BDP27DRAFT_1327965 [Rhodocollybia butyracea]|uniref:Uncharacterized protein n=1 Tax=Rhodocollybia butyracea TaxID=206335 RepID=A0A9P5PR53_9AGAR|nr:hypothetical protein BDP27DRAFT_1327965 [Rhodocollybia butyracea]